MKQGRCQGVGREAAGQPLQVSARLVATVGSVREDTGGFMLYANNLIGVCALTVAEHILWYTCWHSIQHERGRPLSNAEKVRENRLRRMAKRQRLALVKSRRRDPRAWDYGAYGLIDLSLFADSDGSDMRYDYLDGAGGMSLDEIETRLTGADR